MHRGVIWVNQCGCLGHTETSTWDDHDEAWRVAHRTEATLELLTYARLFDPAERAARGLEAALAKVSTPGPPQARVGRPT